MTHDPYVAPATSKLATTEAQRDLRWRGAIWLSAPLFVLAAIIVVHDFVDMGSPGKQMLELFQLTVAVLLPAAIAGYACGRRCRTTFWPRFLLMALRDGVAWVAYGVFLLWLHDGEPDSWQLADVPGRIARVAMFVLPFTLLLATTMRFHHRRRT